MASSELPPNDPRRVNDAAEALWRAGRDAAREDVRSIFAPRRVRCGACGAEETTSSTRCPRCGATYTEWRRGRPGRAGWLAAAAAAAALSGVAVLVAAVFAPGVRRSSARTDAAAAMRTAAAERAAAAALLAAQAPRFGTGRPAPRGPAASSLPARAGLLRRAETLITSDVRARAAAGLVDHSARGTVCEPTPDTEARRAAERDPRETDLTYSCVAQQADIAPNTNTTGGTIGLPFALRMHTASGRLAWCEVHPPAGERGLQGDEIAPPPSPVCAGA